MKKLILILPLYIFFSSANAQTVADVANGLIPQISEIPDVIAIVSYLAGVVCMIKAALKLKEANESRGQVKISGAIIFAIAAALFLALPTFVNTGIEFMGFDTGGQSKY